MGQEHALALPRRARRVDDRGQVVSVQPRRPALELFELGGSGFALEPAVEVGLDGDHPTQRRRAQHLAGQLLGTSEADDRAAVLDDSPHSRRQQAREDWHRHGGGGLDPEVCQDPLEPVLGDEGDSIPRSHPFRHQGCRHPQHALTGPGPAQAPPVAVLVEIQKGPLTQTLGLGEERLHRRPRYGGFSNRPHRVRVPGRPSPGQSRVACARRGWWPSWPPAPGRQPPGNAARPPPRRDAAASDPRPDPLHRVAAHSWL